MHVSYNASSDVREPLSLPHVVHIIIPLKMNVGKTGSGKKIEVVHVYFAINKGPVTCGGAPRRPPRSHTRTWLKLALRASTLKLQCFQRDRQVLARASCSLDHLSAFPINREASFQVRGVLILSELESSVNIIDLHAIAPRRLARISRNPSSRSEFTARTHAIWPSIPDFERSPSAHFHLDREIL